MKKLIALVLIVSLTGAVIAQQPVPPRNDPHARNDHDRKDKKDRHHHRRHHEEHKDDHKK